MDYLERYEIPLNGMKMGPHRFEFKAGKKFFEQIENTEIKEGSVDVVVDLVREERLMDLHFDLVGKVVVPCDRCNEPIEVEIKGKERLILKLGDRFEEEDDEIQIIPENLHTINLTPFIYEYIALLIPVRKVHPEDVQGNSQCNPEILKKLRELNEKKEVDPRWEALNKLKNNSEN